MKFLIIRRFLFLLFAIIVPLVPAYAESRVALVIGNATYNAAGGVSILANPANDAGDMAKAFEALSFEVTLNTDLTYDGMRRALRSFSEAASNADVAVVFFAGHGIEVNRRNYLIPVDARLKRADDVDFEAVPLDLVMGALSGARKLKLVLLDACRNNPFAAGMQSSPAKRSIGRGLARVEPAVGTLVSFAAKEGTIASDGQGRNSPYTKAFLEELREPGLEINFLFRKVRDRVLAATNGRQEPFTYGSLPGTRLFLHPKSVKPKKSVVRQPDYQLSEAAQVWASTRETKSIAVLEVFRKAYEGTPFAALARARIAELKEELASRNQIASQNAAGKLKPPVATDDDAEQKKQTVATITSPSKLPAEPSPRFANDKALVRAIQTALNRHRCNAGSVDGSWGRKGISAVKRFSQYAKLSLGTEPTEDLFDAVDRKKGKACPLVCGARYKVRGDDCVLKTCGQKQQLTRSGKCISIDSKPKKDRVKTRTVSKPIEKKKVVPREQCGRIASGGKAWGKLYCGASGFERWACGEAFQRAKRGGWVCD